MSTIVVAVQFSVGGAAAETTCPAGMSYVPGGSYTSLSTGSKPATVAPFCADTYEVTVKSYGECAQSGKCTAAATGDDCNGKSASRGNHPINCVQQSQAAQYCAAQGKRLPTMEELEWAARGGSAGTTYPWGNAKPKSQLCWAGDKEEHSEEFHSATCPVGKAKGDVSPQGVRDLAGNVEEWTSNPGPNGDDHYTLGGSAWSWDAKNVKCSSRSHRGPKEQDRTTGFRCVTAAK
jgi:formylglycine-generating enzyme required for sulfatase activity